MKFIDWFAGVGGFRLGLERAGMRCVASCEIDKNARKVYERRFNDKITWADIRDVDPEIPNELWPPPAIPRADLWCGGFPCQGLSVAGKRGGLDDPRSGLWWEWMRLVERHRPAWLLIENVPGLLSCNDGNDFGLVMASLAYIGYDGIWRVLDAQFFGVPQRRRRVFIVGHLGGPCPPEILFEPEGGGGDTAKGGKAGQDIAHSLDACTGGPSGKENQQTFVASTLSGGSRKCHSAPKGSDTAENLIVDGRASKGDRIYSTEGPARSVAATNGGLGAKTGLYLAPTLRCTDPKKGGPGDTVPITVCSPADPDRMRTPAGIPRRMDMQVCSSRNPLCADSPRYRALGNAVAVPVIEWIGKRIMEYAI